jgi:hypothetical protein
MTDQEPKWKTSDAKKHLRSLIETGEVTNDMPPREVLNLSPLFLPYEKNFAANLRSLRKTIRKDRIRAAGHAPPDWRSSAAKMFLYNLVLEGGPVEKMEPEEAVERWPILELYWTFDKEQFKNNFLNLLDTVKQEKKNVAFDEKNIRELHHLYLAQDGKDHWHNNS